MVSMEWAKKFARRFGVGRSICLPLLLGLLVLRIADPAALEELRLRTFDLFQTLAPRVPEQHPVVIVDIDEQSLRKFGQWPWARTRVAELVRKLTEAGATVVGFDIIFAEPDRLSPALAADSFGSLDEETRARLRALPSNDQILADALKQTRAVLGQTGLPTAVAQNDGKAATAGIAALGPDARPYLYSYPGLLRNIPVLEQAAAGRGLFTIRSERDGIIRRVPMVLRAQGEILPSLTLEMLRVAAGATTLLIKSDEGGVRSVRARGFELPTDRNAQLWVHFASHDPNLYISAADILEGRAPTDRISGRMALIGTSAAGLLDLKTTPVHAAMPGVEVHAQVLESVFDNSMLSSPSYALGVELLSGTVISSAIIVLAPLLSPVVLIGFGLLVIAFVVGSSWYLFSEHQLLIDFTFPLLTSLLVYLTLVFTNYFREQTQRRQIRTAFSQYLSPALVEQLAQSPEKLVLGGQQRDMSIMFSDVRGFTTISEIYKDDPQGLTTLMNRFLTPLTNAIIDHRGTIDKYMGDAIMAFWNAPLDDASHELNACEAALSMLDRVRDLNRQRKEEAALSSATFIPINIGVGINTGRCVVGNMGSDLRFDYSVLGDTVNLASRLEGQCKSYGLPIIIGSKTADAVKEKFAIFELDFIAVKGKREPEVVYTILGRQDLAQSTLFQRLRDVNGRMLSLYRSRQWDDALAAVEEARGSDEEARLQTLYEVYITRIRQFKANPPPEDWNGAYALETK